MTTINYQDQLLREILDATATWELSLHFEKRPNRKLREQLQGELGLCSCEEEALRNDFEDFSISRPGHGLDEYKASLDELSIPYSISLEEPSPLERWGLDFVKQCLFEGQWRRLDPWHKGAWLNLVVRTIRFSLGYTRAPGCGGEKLPTHPKQVILEFTPEMTSAIDLYLGLGEAVNGPGGYFGGDRHALEDCFGSSSFGAAEYFDLHLRNSPQVRRALGPEQTWCYNNRKWIAYGSHKDEQYPELDDQARYDIHRGYPFLIKEHSYPMDSSYIPFLQTPEEIFAHYGQKVILED